MGKIILTILFVFFTRICSAPAVDFWTKMVKFRSVSDYLHRKHNESEFVRFINDLGYRESRNDWSSVNLIGCFGEWQFAESTLHYLGFRSITLRKFKKDPLTFPREMQVKALKVLIEVNLSYLRDYEHFIGDSINGVAITKSGMIAASHLGGAGSLKKFLNSNGKVNSKDVLGTSIFNYLKEFSSYDLE